MNLIIESQLLKYLDSMNITYLTEFSGRRGIHVWILFSNVFSKALGFELVNNFSKMIELDELLFDLDIFPATDSARGNKVGKQVKFPLSFHKDGGQSFIFIRKLDFDCIYKLDFYEQQYKILSSYYENDIDEVICIQKIVKIADNSFMNKVFKVYNYNSVNIEENNFPIIREFNQPKRNAFPKDNLVSENIASILVKKKEFNI